MTRARQPLPPLAPNYNLLNIDEVAKLLRVSKRTIQRWVRRKIIPQPIRLSPQKVVWRESTILELLAARSTAANANGEAEQQ